MLEEREGPNPYHDMWKWRGPLELGQRHNGLEEGEAGPRVLAKQAMATARDWTFQQHRLGSL